MLKISDFLKFVFVNLLGFFSFGAIFYLAYFTGNIPSGLAGEDKGIFFQSFFGGTVWAWIAGFIVSCGFFFAGSPALRRVLLLAAVYIPVTYGVLNLVYFNAFHLRSITALPGDEESLPAVTGPEYQE